LAFAHNRAGSDIVTGLAERLDAVRDLLLCYADGRSPDRATEEKIIKLESRGTSILRRILRRSGYVPYYRVRMSGVVALVGRLVDVAATMTQLHFKSAASDRVRFRSLAGTLAGFREDLVNQRSLGPIQFAPQDATPTGVPLLREMEAVSRLIPSAFAASTSMDDYLPRPEEIPPLKLFVPDAFVNPEHVRFAVRGCLAASACYAIYNVIDWPGLSTSVTTCLVTALSTIGTSRQKQILRLAGFLIGGVILGMGAQILILPGIDSITAFTLLFLFVTALSAWIMTASPRLSYLGFQVAFGFYYINLVEYTKQTSLTIARDRVVGILLGLSMMWLVFDRLGSTSAGREMKQSFIGILRLLAQFAKAPLSDNHREEIKQTYALRAMIDARFDSVRSQADGILFEFGPSRRQDLAFRDCVRQWQPQLRALFLMRISSLKFRLQLQGFELPDSVRRLHREYDFRSAEVLEEVANQIEGATPGRERTARDTSELLDRMLLACCTDEAQQFPASRIQSFVNLLRAIDDLTTTLARGITAAFDFHCREVQQ
jgi:multidrug resistance protein MdtO